MFHKWAFAFLQAGYGVYGQCWRICRGEPVNHSKLGGSLEIDGKMVNYYLDILVDLLLVRRLEPWYANVKKRLVKSPRYYIRDSGIQHRLLGINSHDALLSNPVLGKSWEGFVIENIRFCSVISCRSLLFQDSRRRRN